LVAAADGEHGDAMLVCCLDRAALGGEIGCDERLLAILATADVEEVVFRGLERVADTDRPDVELVAAQGGATFEHGDVPSIGVDVEVVGVEVTDADSHAR
jgi:hypothetical protein